MNQMEWIAAILVAISALAWLRWEVNARLEALERRVERFLGPARIAADSSVPYPLPSAEEMRKRRVVRRRQPTPLPDIQAPVEEDEEEMEPPDNRNAVGAASRLGTEA